MDPVKAIQEGEYNSKVISVGKYQYIQADLVSMMQGVQR